MYDKDFFSTTLPDLAEQMKIYPGVEITLVDGSKFDIATIRQEKDNYFVADVYPQKEELDKRKKINELDRLVIPYDRIVKIILFESDPSQERKIGFTTRNE